MEFTLQPVDIIYPEIDYSKLNLKPYLEVYGNEIKKNLYLLALRFKKPIIKYTSIHSAAIEIPDGSIILVKGKLPKIKNENCLLFTLEDNPKFISVQTLLSSLIPHKYVEKEFSNQTNVLFLIPTQNPFQPIWKKCRRDAAFRALETIINVTLFQNRFLNLKEMALLRLFNRNSHQLHIFKNWYTVSYELSISSFKNIFQEKLNYHLISKDLGQNIYQIIVQSINHTPANLLDPSFYECEILLTDTELVGIIYRIEEGELLYVSPMIISYPPKMPFSDINRIECNSWIPLYKNPDNWLNFCIPHYLNRYFRKRNDLKLILA